MGLTIKELLPVGEKILKDTDVECYKINAEVLLCFVAGFDRKELFLYQDREASDTVREEWLSLINRRAKGEPLQYITGEQYFMGHRFSVDPSVLIPRPETELLAEKAIDYLHANGSAKTVLDLCTGSGVLAISLAIACPRVKITASDISHGAIAIAVQNAAALDVSDRIAFVLSNLFSLLPGRSFDLIVTNPPYLKTVELMDLSRVIADHEPLSALDGGPDGLDFYRRIAVRVRSFMSPGACLMAEIGANQAEEVSAIFIGAGFTSAEISKDLNGLDRVLTVF